MSKMLRRSTAGTVARTSAFFLACVLATGATGGILVGCDSEPTVDDYINQSGIHQREKIRIAVYDDSPLIGQLKNGRREGFDVELGRYLARSLGFDSTNDKGIEWISTTVEGRERRLLAGQADLVIAAFSITPEREKIMKFAGPYLITGQELMVTPDLVPSVQNLADVVKADVEVCLPGTSTGEAYLGTTKVRTVLNVESKTCMDGLESGKYKIFSTDEVVLAGFNATSGNKFSIVNIPTRPELYGVAMSLEAGKLQAVVQHFLMKSYLTKGGESPWQVAWNKTLKNAVWPSTDGRTQPPPTVGQRLRDADDKDRQPGAALSGVDRGSPAQPAVLAAGRRPGRRAPSRGRPGSRRGV